MHALRELSCGLRERSSLWFKPQEYKREISKWKKEISVARKNGDRQLQLKYTSLLAETYYYLKLYAHVIDCSKTCIDIAKEVDDKPGELKACHLLVKTYDALEKYNHSDAIQYSKRCIELAEEINEKKYFLKACYLLVRAYGFLNQYDSAVIYAKKYLECTKETGDHEGELKAYHLLIRACDLLGQYDADTVSYCQKYIDITEKTGDQTEIKIKACMILVKAYECLQQYDENAILYCQKCLDILQNTDNKQTTMKVCYLLVKAHDHLKECSDAIPYIKIYIEIAKDIDDKQSEFKGYHLLGIAFNIIGKYKEAVNCSKKGVDVAKEIGNQQYEMKSCLQLAESLSSLKNYDAAAICCNECIEKAKLMGDKPSEMEGFFLLSSVFYLKKQYNDAISVCKKCVDIAHQMNDRKDRLAKAHLLLGKVYYSLNQYDNAIVHCRKCIRMEQFAGKQEEISIDAYSILVESQCRLGYHHPALAYGKICIQRAQQTSREYALSNVYYCMTKALYSLKIYDEAINYCEKCMDIAKQHGDKSCEMKCRLLLASVFYEQKKYNNAIDQSKKCIDNATQEGNTLLEIMEAHLLIANSYFSLKCYEDATCNIKKCIKMAKETGHLKFELQSCVFIARIHLLMGNIRDLVLAIAQSLVLAEELDDTPAKQCVDEIVLDCLEQQQHGLISVTENSGSSEECTISSAKNETILDHETETLKKIEKLIILHQKYIRQVRNDQRVDAIATMKQIEDIDLGSMNMFLKSFCRQKIGCLYLDADQREEAISQLRSAISCAQVCSTEIKNQIIFQCSRVLGVTYFKNGEIELSINFLQQSISCIDFFVNSMEADENTIIDFIDKVNDCFNYLAKGLIKKNRIHEALLVLEQRTARALKEQLISRHEIKRQERHEEHITYQDISSLVSSYNYSILFCSVFSDCLYTFLIEKDSDVQFRQFPSHRTDTERSIETMLGRFSFNNKNRKLTDMDTSITAQENNSCNVDQDISKTAGRILTYFGSSSRPRTPKEACENVDVESITSDLERLYYMLFGKMSIKQDELVIIPDGPLYKVPFAALRNPDTGQYLSETKRIRIAPSITTLKLLQEIPVSQSTNPALVVGNPLVGEVMMEGEKRKIRPLSAAFREANAVSTIFNSMTLTGEKATKPVVLKQLQQDVPFVHIAAHGCFNNGTIALAPPPEIRGTKIPVEEDYMLTMKNVQQVHVRTPCVVLSSCETGCGEIKAEGLIGMCRAFLVAGARAVIASLWAIHDQATSEFMKRFYSHLRDGKLASTSLQCTMEEMRQLPIYADPKYWAPFFLLGDNFTINCN